MPVESGFVPASGTNSTVTLFPSTTSQTSFELTETLLQRKRSGELARSAGR